MVRRVVVTGLGVVSCLGNEQQGQTCSARASVSVMYLNMRSLVCVVALQEHLTSKGCHRWLASFVASWVDASLYAYHAMRYALNDAELAAGLLTNSRNVGLVVGSGVSSPFEHLAAVDRLREGGLAKVLPYAVPRVMGSTTSACLSTAFGIQGVSYSMISACATAAHCIGHAAELIQLGKQDVVFAGGAEVALDVDRAVRCDGGAFDDVQ